MNLTQPTDFEILEALDEYGRNVASNLSHHLNRDRAYLNTRFPDLLDYGLVERVGPSENSGLYEITNRGETVLEHRHEYDDLESQEFEELIKQQL